MISRLWKALCAPSNADAYERLLLGEVLPQLDQAEGCMGAYVLRREVANEVEFVVVHLFESLDAIKAFAGDDYETAVVPSSARRLLASFDQTATHFDVRAMPRRVDM